MRILILGGTSFVGPHVVRELAAAGHQVTLFHRGRSNPEFPANVEHVHGDFAEFEKHVHELRKRGPDVVLDMVPFREEDGRRVLSFHGVARRGVVLSSCDVYRAFGRVVRTEPGDPDPVPLDERSPLREKLSIGGENYNKTAVERVAGSNLGFPCAILRLPAIHGPGDYQHRLYGYAKRMFDRRPAVLIDQNIALWKWMRGYVEDVAHAVALAVLNERSAGRIYNVADAKTYGELDWVNRIARAIGYTGQVVAAPTELLPQPLRGDIDPRQQMIVDTTRIRTELGFCEISEEDEALKKTVAWELSHPPQKPADGDFDYAAEDEALRKLN